MAGNGNGKNGRGNGVRPHHFDPHWLRIEQVNVLPQPRRTFENIAPLATDIGAHWFLNPPNVAAFDREAVTRYVEAINNVWGTTLRVENLVVNGDNGHATWYVLLAGERRFRAFKHLREIGCDICIEKYGRESSGVCFARHVPNGLLEVRLAVGIRAVDAISIQLSENTHMAVPPAEEAEAYARFLRLLRDIEPNLTLTAFAHKVGRSPEKIRNALAFCDLPDVIKRAVHENRFKYGVALELFRLQHAGLGERELVRWADIALADRLKVEDLREKITRFLEDRASPQAGLMSIFKQTVSEDEAHRRRIRQVVAVHMLKALWAFIAYANTALELFRRHELGDKSAPYSEGSPLHVFRTLMARLRALLDFLAPHMRKGEVAEHVRTLDEAERLFPSAMTEISSPEDGETRTHST